MLTVPRTKDIEKLDNYLQEELREYIEYLWADMNYTETPPKCPRHLGNLEIGPDLHIQCPACYQEGVDHV